MKNNKGITLIALVVTIIVLLILAGVSIAMLTGQNGILNRASQASYQTQIADAAETINYAVTEAITDYYNGAYVANTTAASDSAILKAIQDAVSGASIDSSVTRTVNEGKTEVTLTYNGHTKKGTIAKEGVSWKAVDANS